MSDSKSIERANSYRQMMSVWAWTDFSILLDTIRQDALESAINSTDLTQVYIQRGIVKCVDKIRGEIGFILEDTGK